eukprot:Platyproteum_vivax@DN316_c0_g1_i1.p1
MGDSNDVSNCVTALSPIDGRYCSKTMCLRRYLSEYALIKYRVQVEVAWLLELSTWKEIDELYNKLSDTDIKFLESVASDFNEKDAQSVKDIEATTNHDVKAVEYFLKNKVEASGLPLKDYTEFIHFGCTSEDINNLSYALMLKDSMEQVLIPKVETMIDKLAEFANEYADTPLLSRTHGQPATPTTFGKEIAIFAWRLNHRLTRDLKFQEYLGKFNGAVGNYNAHVAAYPQAPWPKIAEHFVKESLGLSFQPYSTQIESHDYIAEISTGLSRLNSILLDLCQDVWSYISRDLLKLKVIKGEVGSSTMPHKVNPIDFENAEGNLGLANALLNFLATKLPISRLQRDLSDSTVLRNLGPTFGHCLIAYESIIKGLNKIVVDRVKCTQELEANCMVLAEPIQTILRKEKVPNSYEMLKELTRGAEVNEKVVQDFITNLKVGDDVKKQLGNLSATTYIGLASELTLEMTATILN